MKTKLIYLGRPPILGIEDGEDDAQSGGNPEEIPHMDIDANGDDDQTGTSHENVSSKEIYAKAGEKRTLASEADASAQEKKLKKSISEQSISLGHEHERSVVLKPPEPTAFDPTGIVVPIGTETIATMLKGWMKELHEAKTRAQYRKRMVTFLQEQNQVLRDGIAANERRLETLKINELKLQEQIQAKKAELSRLKAKLKDQKNHCSAVESESESKEAAIDAATHAVAVLKSWNPSVDVSSLLRCSRNEIETRYSTLAPELLPVMRRFVRSLYKNEGFTN